MPEKVHVKFGDSAASQQEQDTNAPVHTQKLKQSSLKNGVKRMRDGSLKAISRPGPKGGPEQAKSDETHKTVTGSTQAAHTPVSGTVRQNGGSEPFARSAFTKSLSNGIRSSKHKRNSSGTEHEDRQKLHRIAQQHENTRKLLPIWPKKADIRCALRNNDVLLINGETGSGKSTQVPQFLYTESWCRRQMVQIQKDGGKTVEESVGGIIAITQPRRVAATTLARRVASEMGSPFSGEVGEVGYAVRFDSFLPKGTKIKFVTEGMLLQEMLHDPYLRKYSAVIVDEIHERSVDVDLIAGFLRNLVHGDKKGRGGVPLKVIIMSATLDLGGIEAFFARPTSASRYTPGKNHGRILAPNLLEDEVDGDVELEQQKLFHGSSSWGGLSDSDNEISNGDKVMPASAEDIALARNANRSTQSHISDLVPKSSAQLSEPEHNGVAVEYVRGRQYEVEIMYEVKPTQDYLHTILQTVLQLHVTEPLPGDILVFLTGQDEIESLRSALSDHAEKIVKTLPRMKIMPLYGALPAAAQQEAFEKVKEKFTRKIVLATNIAETSITVSGVRFVVDCGKSKVKQYRPRLGMESLLAKPISRVSAIQRAGRAGREAKGKCFRIYTEEDYLKFDQDEFPEILRSDVLEAVLKMKSRGVGDVSDFPLMDSPDIMAIQNALKQLHMMGAVDDVGNITTVGKKMATFPLPATYGRVLIAAAEPRSDMLLEVIDVISCLTTDSEIFNQPKSEDDQENIIEARKDLLSPDGDIVTLLAVIGKYASVAHADRLDWCRQRLIAPRAMKMALQIRQQLRQICRQQKLLSAAPPTDSEPYEPLSPERVVLLLKTFLTAFAAKTALLAPDGSYVMAVGRNPIAVHPSSVLFGQKKSEAIMFLEHVFTTKNYAKKVSPVQANWIEEAFTL
ncbi:P-loop containing nucleoside triphosphate hydrolase protein [Cadophora sp. DSE1049]|nr:P-loop containing nucleoside triphosphate hydrolase protein [Cadophora sp. DSE1049]